MKSKQNIGDNDVFTIISSYVTEARKKYTDKSKDFIEACQDQQWNHDVCTPHRGKTNGVAETAVRRVKEGTAIALVPSGLAEEWWDGAMECC